MNNEATPEAEIRSSRDAAKIAAYRVHVAEVRAQEFDRFLEHKQLFQRLHQMSWLPDEMLELLNAQMERVLKLLAKELTSESPEQVVGAALALWQLGEPSGLVRALEVSALHPEDNRPRVFDTIRWRSLQPGLKPALIKELSGLQGLDSHIIEAFGSEERSEPALAIDMCELIRPRGWEGHALRILGDEYSLAPDRAAQVLGKFAANDPTTQEFMFEGFKPKQVRSSLSEGADAGWFFVVLARNADPRIANRAREWLKAQLDLWPVDSERACDGLRGEIALALATCTPMSEIEWLRTICARETGEYARLFHRALVALEHGCSPPLDLDVDESPPEGDALASARLVREVISKGLLPAAAFAPRDVSGCGTYLGVGDCASYLDVFITADAALVFDLESAGAPNRHDRLLCELAQKTLGKLVIELASEEWHGDEHHVDGHYCLRCIANGCLYETHLQGMGDWYDADGSLRLVNRMLADAGVPERLQQMAPRGQFAAVLFARPDLVKASQVEFDRSFAAVSVGAFE